jgi:hypothetical protein
MPLTLKVAIFMPDHRASDAQAQKAPSYSAGRAARA